MSDLGNSVRMATDFESLEEVASFFGGTDLYEGRCWLSREPAREVTARHPLGPASGFQNLTDSKPDTGLWLDSFPRSARVDQDLVADESALVVSCIMAQDRIRRGEYQHEYEVVAHWDWDDEGVVLESIPEFWDLPESRALRQRLNRAGIPYQARQSRRPDPSVFKFLADDLTARWGQLGSWDQPEAWLRAGRLHAVGSVLDVTTGVEKRPYDLVMRVNLYGLAAFVRDLVQTAEGDPVKLEAVPYWRDVLVDAVAILLNSDRDLPAAMAGDAWADVVDQARAVAAEMLAEADW